MKSSQKLGKNLLPLLLTCVASPVTPVPLTACTDLCGPTRVTPVPLTSIRESEAEVRMFFGFACKVCSLKYIKLKGQSVHEVPLSFETALPSICST